MNTLDKIVEEIVMFCAKEKVSEISQETIDDYIDAYADEFLIDASDAVTEKLPEHNIEVVE